MTKFIEAKTRKEAVEKIGKSFDTAKKVNGGWIFFDTVTDYEIWRNQK